MKLSEMIDYLQRIQKHDEEADPEFIVLIGNTPLIMKEIFLGKCNGKTFCALEIDVQEDFKPVAQMANKLLMQFVEKMEGKDDTKH
jgi:hypothetical protein